MKKWLGAGTLVAAAAFIVPTARADLFIPVQASDIIVSVTGDDITTGPHALGFSFPFYASSQTSVFMNSNGNLTFGAGFTDANNAAFPLALRQMIAPFWDDLFLPPGQMRVNTSTAGVANFIWNGVDSFFGTAAPFVTAEATLLGPGNPYGAAPGTIIFSYGPIAATNDGSVTIGLNAGAGGNFDTLNEVGIGAAGGLLNSAQALGLTSSPTPGPGPGVFTFTPDGTNNFVATRGGPAVIPEPGTVTLFGIGVIGLGCYGWRRRRMSAQ